MAVVLGLFIIFIFVFLVCYRSRSLEASNWICVYVSLSDRQFVLVRLSILECAFAAPEGHLSSFFSYNWDDYSKIAFLQGCLRSSLRGRKGVVTGFRAERVLDWKMFMTIIRFSIVNEAVRLSRDQRAIGGQMFTNFFEGAAIFSVPYRKRSDWRFSYPRPPPN